MIYQSYNSITKHLFCTNQLNTAYVSKIPPSTRHAWKVKYASNPDVFDPQKSIAKSIAHLKSALHILIETLPKQNGKKAFWKKHLNALCSAMNQYQLANDKIQILKLINIAPQAFAKWTAHSRCDYSLMNLCIKKHPNQLREEDKNCIKHYMQNPLYEFYNRTQIYWIMRNEKALLISKRTFHKYCDLMGLHKRCQKKLHKKKSKGIIAHTFLEKIHIDITHIGLLNHTNAYILNIVDNHTRYLVESIASSHYNSQFVSDTLEAVIIKHKLNEKHTEIIADGGSENQGKVLAMLQKYPNIRLTIAKKDTPHLNNIVEAAHKRLKNNVIPHHYFTDIDHLQQKLPSYKALYNQLPQHHLQGKTPNDATQGIVFDSQENKLLTQLALQSRVIKNKNLVCCMRPV